MPLWISHLIDTTHIPRKQPAVLMNNNEKDYAENIELAAERMAEIIVQAIDEKFSKQKKREREPAESTEPDIISS